MNWFESIVYGLISGLTEFLPLSSYAHQRIFMHLCGQDTQDPAMNLFVHIALALAIWRGCRTIKEQIARDQIASRKGIVRNTRLLADHRLVKQATIPLLISLFIVYYIFSRFDGVLPVCIGLVLNGVVLFLPERMLSGNRDARTASTADRVLLGISGALSAIPGLSRIGCTVSYASMRGYDRKSALQWALLLSIYALGAYIVIDIINLLAGIGSSAWGSILNYLLAGIIAYFSGAAGINFIRFLSAKHNLTIFAFYNWGASLFAFILYLSVI